MTDERPNPDDLLAQVQAAEASFTRGKLKIFFGYAAGVGKTYAMLEAARREKSAGLDVVVGYVEPHGRAETESLLEGLETLPPKMVPYRGVELRELDLDAALARRPQLILVDELAHTNAEGLRHAKRWQDVVELLDSGIDVYTTLNVQHIESLNDVIAQITGVVIRETLPDSVVEQADDLELVDITPEELVERLRAGKVYVPLQAERAIEHFFQKPNLLALRELSLRQTADRVQRDVELARKSRAAKAPWATSERLLVCIGPSPTTARVIRTARRMAAAFDARWFAVCVDTGERQRGTEQVRERIARHLRMAERLGAEVQTLVGDDIAGTIVEFAQAQNVTKIIVGKTGEKWWTRLLFGSVVQDLLRASGDIDVYVIRGEVEDEGAQRTAKPPLAVSWEPYAKTAAVVAVCGLIGWLIKSLGLAEANVIMVFLLGVAFAAARYGRGPSIAAAVAGVLIFDFFFVTPYLTFAVSDTQYVLTFGVMLLIGLVISTLTTRLRAQVRSAGERERRASALYRLTQQLARVSGTEFLVNLAGQQLADIFRGEVVIYLRETKGRLEPRFGGTGEIAKREVNSIVAQWVSEHDQVAGAGTDTLPNATALFVPLVASQSTVGAIGVRSRDLVEHRDVDQRRLLETCAGQIALAIERDQLALEAHEAKLKAEAEQLRNSLLSSVSHDLRTPLAAIAGAGTSLLDAAHPDDEITRRELLQTIVDESNRLARLVDNLLDMSRLESGQVPLERQWHVLEELVGSALRRMRRLLAKHEVHVDIPADLPLISVDGVLMEQVLVNLLENAARYTPGGSLIEIRAHADERQLVLSVADDGPGLVPGSETLVFDKFFRGAKSAPDGQRGTGLGLAICRAVVHAHGGTIQAANRPTGGAEFRIALPRSIRAPRVPLDAAQGLPDN